MSQTASIFLSLSVALLAGLLLSRLAKKVQLPAVTAYLVAGVLIGPYDASIMLETPLDICSDPMTEFIRQVFDCCRCRSISCGSFVDNADLMERYRSLGGNVFWTGTEISLLCEALGNLCEAFRDLNTKEAKTC